MEGRLIVWGGTTGRDSFRHIMRAFHQTASKLGIQSLWIDDREAFGPKAGDTVIAADVTAKHLRYVPNVDYVLHNFDSNTSDLCQALEATPERLLRLQVWTNDATGEEWDTCRQFDREARTLFQPWGSDLLAEEFLEPVFQPQSRDVTFVGAVWSDKGTDGVELGNEAVIGELQSACASRALKLRLLTHITDAENMLAVRSARLAPAFAGPWQCEKNYLPCRYFKTAAYGQLAFGNVPAAEALLGAASIAVDGVAETLDEALKLNRTRYTNLVRDQQRVVARFTYRESIAAIERALREIKT